MYLSANFHHFWKVKFAHVNTAKYPCSSSQYLPQITKRSKNRNIFSSHSIRKAFNLARFFCRFFLSIRSARLAVESVSRIESTVAPPGDASWRSYSGSRKRVFEANPLSPHGVKTRLRGRPPRGGGPRGGSQSGWPWQYLFLSERRAHLKSSFSFPPL